MIRLILLLISICVTTFASGEKYYLSICSLFRNEARFLREWIEYHHLLGVEHFYLFNNLSDDHYLEVLEPYIDSGLVELIEWPYEVDGVFQFGAYVQIPAYQKILNEKKEETFWLAFVDTDEFIVPKMHATLTDFLRGYEKYGGVVINWQEFGTSSVKKVPENQLMIELLTKKSPVNDERNHFVKSIVIPARVPAIYSPHFASYYSPYFAVSEDKKKVPLYKTTKEVKIKKIQINHYFSRDEEFLYNEKARRYANWHHETLTLDPKYDTLTDTCIFRFVPKLKQRMDLNDDTTSSSPTFCTSPSS